MFLRFVSQSIRRSPRRKAMTVAAVAMGTAVATAMLGVMLDIGDRVNREMRSLGANLMVTPKARSLPVEIGGISYRPVSSQDYIPEDQVLKIKSTFWHLNITGLAPSLKASVSLGGRNVPVEGVWFRRRFRGADGARLDAGLRTVNGGWKVDGRWIDDRDRNDGALDAHPEAMVGGAVARPIWRVADNEGKVLGKIRGLMLLIALAALASAGLTVWSVMATTVLERRGEIAIMQATGAGSALVAALFSTEVALEGAAGGLIGSFVGLLLAAWVGRAVFQTSLEIPAMLGPIVVGAAVLASVAGAAQPLRRALRLEPAVALREAE
jgi:ABC-type antimicrobial peptide transport system permease subunit